MILRKKDKRNKQFTGRGELQDGRNLPAKLCIAQ